jgi:hypothetical protein
MINLLFLASGALACCASQPSTANRTWRVFEAALLRLVGGALDLAPHAR